MKKPAKSPDECMRSLAQYAREMGYEFYFDVTIKKVGDEPFYSYGPRWINAPYQPEKVDE